MRKIIAALLAICSLFALCSCELPALSIELDPHFVTLKVGDTSQIYADVFPNSAGGELAWQSSDENVAKVEDGKITAIGIGSTEIKVYAKGGKTASCLVVVEGCDHRFGEWEILTEANCQFKGMKVCFCEYCNECRVQDYTDPDNHNFVSGKCINCGKEKYDTDNVVDTPIIDWPAK